MQSTKGLHETLWLSKVKVIHWPLSKVTQNQYFSNFFSSKTLGSFQTSSLHIYWTTGPIKVKCDLELLWDGGKKVCWMVSVICPRWPPYPYMVKTFKIFFFRTEWPRSLSTRVLSSRWQMMTPGWPLTFYAKVNFGSLCICMRKCLNCGLLRH